MNRSGRCYAPISTKTAPPDPTKELPKQKEPKVILDVINEPIIEKEASEFLKFIKHSEYKGGRVAQHAPSSYFFSCPPNEFQAPP